MDISGLTGNQKFDLIAILPLPSARGSKSVNGITLRTGSHVSIKTGFSFNKNNDGYGFSDRC